jgi:hypothetical protein
VFIELTDHLRCTGEHPEQFLVLLPDTMNGRSVVRGQLGCPVCGRVVPIVEGQVAFGGLAPPPRATALTPEAVTAFLGLESPGGFVALLGAAATLSDSVADALPGVQLVAVNAPADSGAHERVSWVRGDRLPLKSGSMRGVVVAGDHGVPEWIEAAAQAVLPGNRIVVEGPRFGADGLEILAQAAGVWVGRRPPATLR